MPSLASRLPVLAATFVLAACSSVRISTDRDRAASLAGLHTYVLAPAAPGERLPAGSEAALCATLRSALASRGLAEAPGSEADLVVERHIFTEEERPHSTGGGRDTQGTLVLDFVDARTRQLVLHGRGSGLGGGPRSDEAKIREAVRRIVARLPK